LCTILLTSQKLAKLAGKLTERLINKLQQSISHLFASGWLLADTTRNTLNVGRQETKDEGRPDRRNEV